MTSQFNDGPEWNSTERGSRRALPMRVGFFLPTLDVGGIEKIVLHLLEGLDRRYFLPVLFLRSCRGALLAEIPSDVAVIDLGGIPLRKSPYRLAQALADADIDLVYSGTNAANLAVLVARMLMRRPPRLIISEHTPISLFLMQAKWRVLRRTLIRVLYRQADRIAVPFLDLGVELEKAIGAARLPIIELPNPVLDRRKIRSEYPLPSALSPLAGEPYFVAAGRLAKEKGFDTLLEAFARVHAANAHAHLVILGEGAERLFLENRRDRLGLKGTVHFLGHISDPLPFFAGAVALVSSSRREGVPNVIVEAMAVGRPVIATECSGGLRFLLNGGRAGLLVPPEDPAALAKAMMRLVTDADFARRLGESGRERSALFTLECAIPAFEKTFIELVARDKSPRIRTHRETSGIDQTGTNRGIGPVEQIE